MSSLFLGQEKRRRKWLYPKRDVAVLYRNIEQTEARTLWQFYQARYGSYDVFSFFVKDVDTYVGEYIGTGEGVETVFDLPGKNTSARTVYKDAVPQTAGGADYTFTADGGTDGADKITFVVAPASGTRLTVDFSGLLRIRVRFKEDSLSYDYFYKLLTTMGIELKGLLNDE